MENRRSFDNRGGDFKEADSITIINVIQVSYQREVTIARVGGQKVLSIGRRRRRIWKDDVVLWAVHLATHKNDDDRADLGAISIVNLFMRLIVSSFVGSSLRDYGVPQNERESVIFKRVENMHEIDQLFEMRVREKADFEGLKEAQ